MLNLILLIIQLALLCILSWGVCEYIRLRQQWMNIKRRIVTMDIDGVIDELLEADQAGPETMTRGVGGEGAIVFDNNGTSATTSPQSSQHRERLAALVAGGQAKQFLGRAWTVDQIETLGEDEVEKLYARYEARLGAAMTKTLGQAALQLYTGMASMFLPIPPENRQALVADLEADPFVGHALGSATCELYHRYGMYLAPLTTALTTAKYCRFGDTSPPEMQCDVSGNVNRNSATVADNNEPGVDAPHSRDSKSD